LNASNVTLEASGSVSGYVDAETLDITSGGEVSLIETNDVVINTLSQNGHSVSVQAGGDITLNDAISTSMLRDITLEAGSDGSGALALYQSVTSESGDIVLDAGSGMSLAESGDITSTSGDVTIDAGSGPLTMTGQTVVDAGSGDIAIDAGGAVTLGKLRTTSTNDLEIMSTGGGVFDGGEGDPDIIAPDARLKVTAAGGIGAADDALEINISAIDFVNTVGGDVALENAGALTIDRISQGAGGSVSVQTLDGAIVVGSAGVTASAGAVSLYAGGQTGSGLTINGPIQTGGGAVSLITDSGDITLADRVFVDGNSDIDLRAPLGAINIDPAASGWLRADGAYTGGSDDFDVDIDWALRHGKAIAEVATGQVTASGATSYEESDHEDNGTILRQANGPYVRTANGEVTLEALNGIGAPVTGTVSGSDYEFKFSPLSVVVNAVKLNLISGDRNPIHVMPVGDTSIHKLGKTVGSSGGYTLIANLAGKQTVEHPVDAGGEDVTIVADEIDLQNVLRSPGAVLELHPRTPDRPIVLGTTDSDSGSAFHLNVDELSNLQDGFRQIVIGSDEGSHHIQIGDPDTDYNPDTGDGQIVVKDPLVLKNPKLGGEIFIDDRIVGQDDSSLVIIGSGHTTTIAEDILQNGYVEIGDSVKVSGVRSVESQTNHIQMGTGTSHSLDGDGVIGDDQLTMTAAGHINVTGRVGNTDPLEGMTISAIDVDFDREVIVHGDLIIASSGVVTFDDSLSVTGDLKITGATNIVFEENVTVTGNILLEGDEIDFQAGNESVSGGGTITLRPATVSNPIEVASPPQQTMSGVLNITAEEVLALTDTFTQIIIGHEDPDDHHARAAAGNVRVGAFGADQTTFHDELKIFGGSIDICDYSNPYNTLTTTGNIWLDAVHDITIYNRVEAASSNIVLYSASGQIQQADPTVNNDGVSGETLKSSQLTATAQTGIDVQHVDVDTLSMGNEGDGDIIVNVIAASGDVTVDKLRQSSAGDSGRIELSTEGGTITVDGAGSGITTAGSGAIALDAQGAGSDVVVNQVVSSQAGMITISAADMIQNSVVISAAGAGTIDLNAGNNVDQDANITSAGGAITIDATDGGVDMADGTTTSTTGSGTIAYSAGTDVALSILNSPGAVSVTADSDGNDTGAITDNLTGETANIIGTTATFSAAEGIGSADDIDTTITTLDAENSDSGNIQITELSAGGSIGVNRIVQSDAEEAGTILLTTENGMITVVSGETGIATDGTGPITLDANGTGSDVAVNAAVTSTTGTIRIDAVDEISNAAVIGASGAGDVDLNAGDNVDQDAGITSAGGAITVDAATGGIDMASGATTSATGSGTIAYTAYSDVALSTLSSGGTVSVTADSGSNGTGTITDNLGTEAANIAGTTATLRAATGIGTSSQDIDTTVTSLAATNSTTGDIYVQETDGLIVGGTGAVTQAGNGSINIDVDAGGLTIDSVVTAHGSGTVTLNADAGTVDINAVVSSTSGAIDIDGGAVTQDSNVTTGSAGTVSVTADAGDITMADATTTTSGGGQIRYDATGSVALSVLTGTGATIVVTADSDGDGSGNITDNLTGELDDTTPKVNIVGGQAALRAGSGIGTDVEDLDLQLSTVAASTESGDINLRNRGALAIGTVDSLNGVTIDNSDATATGNDNITVTASSPLTVSQVVENQDGGDITLAAEGNTTSDDLTIAAAITAAGGSGNINLFAGHDILHNAGLVSAAGSGAVNLSAGEDYNQGTNQAGHADGDVTQADGVTIQSTSGEISVEATAHVALSILSTAGNITIEADDDDFGLSDNTGAITDMLSTEASNLIGDQATLIAATGIGTSSQDIDTTVATLAASNSTSGGIFIHETDGLSIGGSGIATEGGNGPVVVRTADGSITVDEAVSADGSGNILLQAQGTGRDVTLNAAVQSSSGNISVLAADDVMQSADGDILITGGSGTIDVEATAGSITMADGSLAQASGNIRYYAGTNLTLGAIDADGASVSLKADNITDSGTTDTDVTASGLRIETTDAAGGAGQSGNHLETSVATISADVNNGGLFLTELNEVAVDTVSAITVKRVGSDGATLTDTTDGAQSDLASTGAIVLTTTAGPITINEGDDDETGVTATGNVLLQAGGGTSDIVLDADVISTGGNISLNSGQDILQSADVSTSADSKTIDLLAARHIIMASGSSVATTNGNIQLQAADNVSLELLTAGTGNARVVAASGDIADGDTDVDITAAGLILQAGSGVAASNDPLETTVTTLTAQAAADGIFLTESNGATVDTVTVQVNRVDTTATATQTANAAQEDLATTAGGHIALESSTGDLVLSDEVTAADSGNVLLQATTGSITQNNAINGGSGSITVLSGTDFIQKSTIATTGDSKTIDVEATTGSISMDDGTSATGEDNVRYKAAGTISLGEISTVADVSLIAASITDSGTTGTDVAADELRIVTSGTGDGAGAGTGSNHLEITVAKLAADVDGTGSGGLFVTETDSVIVDALNAIAVNRVASDATTSTAGTTDPSLSDLDSAAHLVLATTAGTITINEGHDDDTGVSAAGNALLQALGSTSDVALAADVTSTGGNLSLYAARDILQNADVSTTANSKTIDLLAARNITMADGATTESNDGHIRIEAAGGDASVDIVRVDNLSAGDAAIIAGDDIRDIDAGSLITADELLLSAVSGIGSGANPLNTAVQSLSAFAGSDGMFLNETDAVDIADVSTSIHRVDSAASTAAVANSQEDLRTSGDGSIVLVAGNTITVTEGSQDDSDGNTLAVRASGAGNVFLNAALGNIDIQSGITAASGAISLDTDAGDILQNADGDIVSAGSIDLLAAANITMADGVVTTSSGADIRYEAGTDIALGQLIASGTGKGVTLVSGDDILDAGDTGGADIQAANLLIASTGATGHDGTTLDAIDTAVTSLSATAGDAGMFFNEFDAVTIANVSTSVDRVDSMAATAAIANSQEDMRTSEDGSIVLVAGDTISVTEGSLDDADGNTLALKASGTGNILLNAAVGNIDVQSGITATAGAISLDAGTGDILQNADGDITSGGSIDLLTPANITMSDGAVTTSSGADIRHEAAGDITLGQLIASGSDKGVTLVSGDDIVDGGDTGGADVQADNLLIAATGAAGHNDTTLNHIDTAVANLSATAGDAGLFFNETDAVTLADVSTSIDRVANTAATAAVANSQEDLRTSGDGAIVLVAGNTITVTEGVLNDADGNTLGVKVSGTGNIFLNATAGNIDVQSGITAASGAVSLDTDAGDILQSADGDIASAGSIDLLSAANITMSDGALTTSSGADIRYQAAGNVTLGGLDATGTTDGNVSVIAGNNILDGGYLNYEVRSAQLYLQAGNGVGVLEGTTDSLEVVVESVAGQAAEGGINLYELNAVAVETVSATVDRVGADGSVAATVTDTGENLVTTADSGGSIVLRTQNGDIALNDGADADGSAISADGSGNILVEAIGNATSITANADILSGTGHITLKADDDIVLAGSVDVATATGGTISLDAETGVLTMSGTANVTATGSSARLRAQNNITVGNVTATNVSIDTDAGSIINAAGSSKNVTADNLRLQAQGAIGTSARHMTTNIDVLTALASTGSMYLTEDNAAIVDDVSVTITDFNSDATTTGVTDATQSDLTTGSDGNIALVATLGDITLNNGTATGAGTAVNANGMGNILVDALAGTIAANADILSGTGHITLKADDDIVLAGSVDVATATGGTISLDAETGVLTMAGTANVTATGSSARLRAQNDITVGNVTAADVSIDTDAGSIINAAGSTKNVTADNLRLQAQDAIGTAARHITTNIDVLAALASTGSIYLTEDNAAIVDDVSVTVTDFNSDATTTGVTDATQSDLTTGSDGNIVLVATLGDITLNDGTATSVGTAVNADGAGNILVDALAGTIAANADILSGTGHITLKADDDIALAGAVDVATATGGTISLDAETGVLTMAGTANVTATGSSARLRAQNNITVGNVTATDVSIDTDAGSIINASGSSKNVTADNLRLQAQDAIGTSVRHITTNIDTLTALASTESMYLTEDNGATIDDVSVTVTDFHSDATTTGVTDATQSDLTTAADGNIVLVATLGDITLDDGTATAAGTAVNANGAGNILVDALAGTVSVDAVVGSTSGTISVTGDAVDQNDNIITGGAGAVGVTADTDAITMADGASSTSAGGPIAYQAATGVAMSLLTSTSGAIGVTATTGAITDNTAAEAANLATGGAVTLTAATGIGSDGDAADIDTTIGTLAATNSTSGNIVIQETDGLVVGGTGVVTQGGDGNIDIDVDAGDLTVDAVVTAHGSGTVTLNADAGSVDISAVTGSTNGAIQIDGDSVTQYSDITTGGAGTVSVTAHTDAVAMVEGASTTSGAGAISYRAAENVALSLLSSTFGAIEVTAAAGAITDNTAAETANLATGGSATLAAAMGIGSAGDAADIDTAIATLAATNTTSGNIFFHETDELVIGGVGLRTQAANGTIGVDVDAGELTVNAAVTAHGSGNVRLHAASVGGSVTANAGVQSQGGHISILAGDSIAFATAADIYTSAAGTIDLAATNGSITFSTTSDQISGSGDIRFWAGDNVTLGGTVTTTGSVSITANTGWIRDGDSDGTVDIAANGLRLDGALGIGQLGALQNAIETTVAAVSAVAGAEGINLLESDALSVDDATVTINRVGTDAGTSAVTDATQSDLTTTPGSAGAIVLRTVAGDITLNDGTAPDDDTAIRADGAGNILVQAIGSGTSITLNADVASGSGNVTVLADTDVSSTGTADIISGGSGTIDVEATAGSIALGPASNQDADSGDIRLFAHDNITLGGVATTSGSFGATAETGWIRDGDADGSVDIAADGLRLNAAVGVGQRGDTENPVETTVNTVSALAGAEGINLLETDELTVDYTAVTINRVSTDASTFEITDGLVEPIVEDFDDGMADKFQHQAGTWTIVADPQPDDEEDLAYRAAPAITWVEVQLIDALLSTSKIETTINMEAATGGHYSNGFVIFDCQGPYDFKFAGASEVLDQWVIGHWDGNYHRDAVMSEQIDANVNYTLQVITEGQQVMLSVDGASKLSHQYSDLPADGGVGLGAINARTRFDDFRLEEVVPDDEVSEKASVHMRLVKTPTAVDANGQVVGLPDSETWIDEWDSYWVELWVNTTDGTGVTAGSADLAYNSEYFTATQIEHGPVYVNGTSGTIDDGVGLISDLGGSTTRPDIGGDGYALLGRVKFESLADDQVPIDAERQFVGPYDLGLDLSDVHVEVARVGAVEAELGESPETDLWAVAYDVDDNGRVGFGDFAHFASAFQEEVAVSDTPYVIALDFDHSGRVNFGDFAHFAANFQRQKGAGVDLQFPATYTQRWIGSVGDLTGDVSIGELLDEATGTWQQALGLADPIDVQLIFHDFAEAQLGSGRILAVDDEGRPAMGRVIADDGAQGLGWYSGLDAPVVGGRYDLYTVLLHEIGHTLGFTQAYAGFASHVQTDGDGNTIFAGSDFTATLDGSGHHLDPQENPDDLMNPGLAPGERRLPSLTDVRILQASYEAAGNGTPGFSSDVISLHQGVELAAPEYEPPVHETPPTHWVPGERERTAHQRPGTAPILEGSWSGSGNAPVAPARAISRPAVERVDRMDDSGRSPWHESDVEQELNNLLDEYERGLTFEPSALEAIDAVFAQW